MKPITLAWHEWRKAQQAGDELSKHTTWAAFLLLVIKDRQREIDARAAGAVLTAR